MIFIYRITIGGCRDFEDFEFFKTHLDTIIAQLNLDSDIIILSGHCRGTDFLAERYAVDNGFSLELFPAKWQQYGRSAGVIRNREMVLQSDLVIVFWDGKSKGTKNLINNTVELSKPLQIIYL